MRGPLTHIKVIDLSRFRAGPTCARQLADWGADVIKVEQPGGEEENHEGFDFLDLHRNKRSITLNLKKDAGVEILKKLVAEADVLIENYRPRVKKRLGISYDDLKDINSRLIYCSISGFGQRGPYRDRPGYDQIVQGMSGIMSVTGFEETGPIRVGSPVGDLAAGLYAAQGVLLAIIERERSGKGQVVETSLLEALMGMLGFQSARYLVTGQVPPPVGNHHPLSAPMGVYHAADGPMNIAVGTEEMWGRFCHATGLEELRDDPRFARRNLRVKNRKELNELIDKRLSEKGRMEWVDILNEAGVPSGPIYNLHEAFNDPNTRELNLVEEVDHPTAGRHSVLGLPAKLSRTPGGVHSPAPLAGQHTDKILEDLGYSDQEVAQLREQGVV
jgi:crotonobetainyl-CoA:carnitine CoA-transferase CaiB-like acyl-CoA transferase